MKYPPLIYILPILLLWTLPSAAETKENPLLSIVGKPYNEYHDAYMNYSHRLSLGDSVYRDRLIAQVAEAAAADGTDTWQMELHLFKLRVRFYNSRRGGHIPTYYTAEEYASDLCEIAREAGKKGLECIRLYCLLDAGNVYRVFAQNYERAFATFLELAEGMENVSIHQFPPRAFAYNHIATLFYSFGEYNEALMYYRKALVNPEEDDRYYKAYYMSLYSLGLCYSRGTTPDYNRSDSCFLRLKELVAESSVNYPVWTGLAEARIGYNHLMRGNLDTALDWLLPGVEKIERENDQATRSGIAVNIASIYLKKNDPTTARKWIDNALNYHARAGLPEKDSRLYEVMARYYAYTSPKKATLYLDSTLMAAKHETNARSGLVLRRVEQQLRVADNRLYEQQMDMEQAKSSFYKYTAISIAAILVVIVALLGLTLIYYRRTRNAYRELVLQSQRWAGVAAPDNEPAPDEIEEPAPEEAEEPAPLLDDEPTPALEESDRLIMETIEKNMLEKQLYKHNDLNLDVLAVETGLNRYYISNTLNRCTGKNINTYINEYRIKEAIRIMSDPGYRTLTLDAIADEAGFNDRQNFHRVFKKKTGLSPGVFRKNMDESA